MEYLPLAGQQAVQRSAYTEAITHLTTALELLKTLPDTPERAQQELTLQLVLGPALMATKGYAAPEVERSLHPSPGVVSADGRNSSALPRTVGTVAVLSMRAGVQTARELGEQC